MAYCHSLEILGREKLIRKVSLNVRYHRKKVRISSINKIYIHNPELVLENLSPQNLINWGIEEKKQTNSIFSDIPDWKVCYWWVLGQPVTEDMATVNTTVRLNGKERVSPSDQGPAQERVGQGQAHWSTFLSAAWQRLRAQGWCKGKKQHHPSSGSAWLSQKWGLAASGTILRCDQNRQNLSRSDVNLKSLYLVLFCVAFYVFQNFLLFW